MSLVSAAAGLLAVAALVAPIAPRPATSPAEPATSPAEPGGPPPAVTSASWAWPLHPRPEVARPFAPPAARWLPGHRGVDLLAAGPDASVLSPADGRVRFSGRVAGKEVLVVEHSGGLRSTFEPVVSQLPVGAVVQRRQAVGVLADTLGHCSPETCLHWGVLRGEDYLDPLALIGPQRVRLLPLR